MIYIIGGNGFVGSAFTRYCRRRGLDHRVITRDNAEQFTGTTCDVVINANGNSRKYLADRDPVGEFDQSVRAVAVSLAAYRGGSYVLISTGDVYADPSDPEKTDEARDLDVARMSRYALHKSLAERLVIGLAPNWVVIRAGGFVGPGIKKNAVFDILTGGKVWLSPASRLQYIHTDSAAAIVMGLVERGCGRQIVNLGGSGTVRLGALHAAIGSTAAFDPQAPTVTYELSLAKLTALSGVEVPFSTDEVNRFASGWPESGAAGPAPAEVAGHRVAFR